MHPLLKTTTASTALAAALYVSPIALWAQEASSEDAVASETTATTATADSSAATEGLEATVTADAGAVANPPAEPDAEMQAVLDTLAELGAQPFSELSVEEARSQPTPADAVMALGARHPDARGPHRHPDPGHHVSGR